MTFALLIIYLDSLYQLHTSVSLKWNVELEAICMDIVAAFTEFSVLTSHDSLYNYVFHWLYSPLWLWPLVSQFHDHVTECRTPWTRDQPVAWPQPKHRTPENVYILTYGAGPFLRSRQFCSYSRISQHFMEPEGSLNTHPYQTSMLYMGFEATIPVYERPKTMHASDLWATVTGA
jgi:hypothetical protein